MADPRPTCLGLFAGIGGLERAVHAATGCRVVGYCERDPYAAAVLLARMEDEALEPAPIWCGNFQDDMDTAPFLGVDIVTAGFPCQPFSCAGSQRGQADERWLWDDIAALLGKVRPRWVFLENVPGLVRHGLGPVLRDLAALGFDAEWDLFRASDVGAPHRRERWFLLAHARRGRLDPNEHQSGPGGSPPAAGQAGPGLADPDGGGRLGLGFAEYSGERGPCGRLPGRRGADWPLRWPPGPDGDWSLVPPEAQPAIRRVADGIPARMDRLRCLGNAVVAPQAELAYRTLYARLLADA